MTAAPSNEKDLGVPPEKVQAFFKRRVECIERKKSVMAAAMAECREISEEMKRSVKSLIAEGANKDGLKLEIKIHGIKYAAAVQVQNALDEEDDKVLVSAQALRAAYGSELIKLPLFESAVVSAEKAEARAAAKAGKPTAAAPAAKGRKKKGAAEVDTSAAAKADALNVGEDDDEADLRGTRQKTREQLRQEEATKNLSGIKQKPDDQAPTAH